MGTNAQNEANRRNAKKSTGPRSQAGKAVASQNALKHGLTAERVIIPGEDPSELEEFRRQVESHFEPVGWRETNIVDRIIMQMWRLRRVPEIEAGIFSFQLAKIELEKTRREADENDFSSSMVNFRMPGDQERERKAQRSLDEASNSVGAAFIEDALNGNALGKLARHETTIARSLYLLFAELERVQADRKAKRGENETAPVTIEMTAQNDDNPS